MNSIEHKDEKFTKAEKLIGKQLLRFKIPAENEEPVLTIVGEPWLNIFGIIMSMSNEGDLFNSSFFKGYRCSVTYGEENKYYFIAEDKRIETNAETLAEMLSAFGDNSSDMVHFEMELPLPMLKGLTIRLIASGNDFEEVSYDDVVLNSDYCFMTLSATALLSMSQRRILRKVLLPGMGEELSILVLNSNLIPEDGMEDVNHSLEVFFKGSNQIYYPTEYRNDLIDAVSKIKEESATLRDMRNKRIENYEINYAKNEIKKAIEEFAAEDEKLEDALELIRERAKALPSRQDSASRRCRMKYLSPAQVEYSVELSDFYKMISEKLHEEIEKGDDIQKMQNIIPGYLKNEWARKTSQIIDSIKSSTQIMESYLVDYIEKDIIEYLGNGDNADIASYIIRLSNINPDAYLKKESNQITIKKAKDYTMLKKGSSIAAGVAGLVFGYPLIGAGVVVYGLIKGGSGETLKALEKDRQSLIDAADKLCAEYYESAVEWLDSIFCSLNENMNTAIQESYSKMIDVIFSVIQARQANAEVREKNMEALKQLESDFSEGM